MRHSDHPDVEPGFTARPAARRESGQPSGGRPADARVAPGQAVNGHPTNGRARNGHTVNGHTGHGHATNGRPRNGNAATGTPNGRAVHGSNGHAVGTLAVPAHRSAPALEGPDRPQRRLGALPALEDVASELPARGADPDWDAIAPRGFYAVRGKRILNVVLLACVAPLAILLALPIALVNWAIFGDWRSIFFCQPRVGRHGRVFSIYKFRTMREVAGPNFDSWKNGRDRLRVTRFGRFLRNTHLDELPQLFNVARGEMDFIGPRPEMVEIDRWASERVPSFRERYALLPGITGFAQITRGYAGMDGNAYGEKLEADQHYRRNLSFRLDLEILVRTALWMLRGRGWRHETAPAPAEPSNSSPV